MAPGAFLLPLPHWGPFYPGELGPKQGRRPKNFEKSFPALLHEHAKQGNVRSLLCLCKGKSLVTQMGKRGKKGSFLGFSKGRWCILVQ